jgi:hypothetical protein
MLGRSFSIVMWDICQTVGWASRTSILGSDGILFLRYHSFLTELVTHLACYQVFTGNKTAESSFQSSSSSIEFKNKWTFAATSVSLSTP